MHSVPGLADSSSLAGESQPVTVTVTLAVRFQFHSAGGPGHAGDGRGCTQCEADSSSQEDDAGGLALSALRAGLPEAA